MSDVRKFERDKWPNRGQGAKSVAHEGYEPQRASGVLNERMKEESWDSIEVQLPKTFQKIIFREWHNCLKMQNV